ncbi:hypothetical protein AQI70_24410 [Streptomyces curacoi]|uniref:Uncharacterized protein n=2 Tax=Streptomyces curacoi TaxID=146536 RepID=A0A117P3M0_9ACTN|nr:hypothetical protein AQI70_24410 [Streptomyces curacoi]
MVAALPDADRESYLAANTFITWSGGRAAFSWADFLTHVGARQKSTPAFDAFDLSTGENNLFGKGTTQARHFTLYSLRHYSGGSARLDSDLLTTGTRATAPTPTRATSSSGSPGSAATGAGRSSPPPARAGPMNAVPTNAVPTIAVPTAAVPTTAVPTTTVPTTTVAGFPS